MEAGKSLPQIFIKKQDCHKRRLLAAASWQSFLVFFLIR
ncbi:hypothetical protein SD77_1297 [Bacillus badius]|uniref:Ribose 5-phosphate isomerase B n=1 Tax=Bacillus badius TaxID=1455 RepID=A0ABR5ASI9_BACBA|nr:hypothetical protein SD77_1297 [Bacillus badius]